MSEEVSKESFAERLAEIDKVILENTNKGCELIRQHKPVKEIIVYMNFVRRLWQRRECILMEAKRHGKTEADLLREEKEL